MTSPFHFKHGDRFPILDLIALFNFKSPGSISFDLATDSDTLDFPSDEVSLPVEPGYVFNVIGRVDVHHPCEGHIKAQIRVLIPAQYHRPEQMKELVQQMLAALGIPADETFEASFAWAEQQTGIVQSTDRDGMTDRLY